jgi:hypothetical protein
MQVTHTKLAQSSSTVQCYWNTTTHHFDLCSDGKTLLQKDQFKRLETLFSACCSELTVICSNIWYCQGRAVDNSNKMYTLSQYSSVYLCQKYSWHSHRKQHHIQCRYNVILLSLWLQNKSSCFLMYSLHTHGSCDFKTSFKGYNSEQLLQGSKQSNQV